MKPQAFLIYIAKLLTLDPLTIMTINAEFTYISVKWFTTAADMPKLLVSGLDSHRMERRKLEYFKDGKVGIASHELSTHGTILGELPVPEIEEINTNSEFQATEISYNEFEEIWEIYV